MISKGHKIILIMGGVSTLALVFNMVMFVLYLANDFELGGIIIFISFPFIIGLNVLTIIGALFIKFFWKERDQKRLIYKGTFPFICDSCKEFFHTLAEYCENCGTKGSLREARRKDYEESRAGTKS